MKRLAGMFLVLMLVAAMMGTTVFAGSLNPTPENPLTLRMSHQDKGGFPTDGNWPDHKEAHAVLFKSIVEAKTNGAVKIEIFPNNILGDATQMVEMTKAGSLDICLVTGVMGKFYPKSDLLLIPYLFNGEDVANRAIASPFWKGLMSEMEAQIGIKPVHVAISGFRNFTNNKRPIKTPKDMEGLKIRVMPSPLYSEFVKGLGANPTPIAWSELYTALQTKVVDGQENPVSLIDSRKFYEVQKYLTLDGHTGLDQWFLMNAEKFSSLPKNIQNIITRAARIGAMANIATMEMRSYYLDYGTVSKKMEVYSPTAQELEQFKAAAQPGVLAWLKGKIGKETVEEFLKVVDQAEKDLGYK